MARILIVEDEPAVAEVATLICNDQGHEATVAPTASLALEQLSAESYDIVLLDVLLAGMDGITLARKIRETPGFGELPIIGLTALATPSERAEMLAAGMAEVIAKPYTGRTLREAIARNLR